MKTKDRENVKDTIDREGFDYTFINYSLFDEIKDKKFHELREAYIKAAGELESYLNIK